MDSQADVYKSRPASPPDKSPDLVSVSSDFIGADHLLKTSLPETVSDHELSEFLPPKP